MAEELHEQLALVYGQVATSYHAIDEMRLRLLGLLPLATGVGILALGRQDSEVGSTWAIPAGLFGIFATLGLFSYELHGMKKCAYLINAGRLLERSLNIYGPFRSRPHEVAGQFDEPFAAGVIYPASLAGWTFLTMMALWWWLALASAAVVLLVGFTLTIWLTRSIDRDLEARREYCKEPFVGTKKRLRQKLRSPAP